MQESDLFTALLDAMSQSCLVADASGRITLSNRVANELYGLSGKGAGLDRYVPENRKEEFDRLWNAALSGETAGPVLTIRKNESGKLFQASIVYVPVFQGAERVVIELATPERDVFSTTGPNLRQQAQLALTFVHDLRNPLSILTSLTYILEEKVDPRHMKVMKNQLTICNTIVNNLLELVGARTLEREPLELRTVIEEVLDLVSLSPNISIKITEHKPVFACANGEQLIQAIVNLIQNAVEAIDTKSGEIKIHVSEESGWARIDIYDNGPGIAPEISEKLFQPLVTTKEKGYGLGLFACQQILEANRGKISVQSSPNEGTIFSLFLPLSGSD